MKPAALVLPATVLVAMLIAAGCASGYLAPPSADGAQIFADTCLRCHAPLEGSPDTYFELDAASHNPAYVSTKVRSGSLKGMPKFPGMTDAQLQSLAQFVIDRSRIAPE